MAARFVERDVGLVGRGERVGLPDDPAVEGELRLRVFKKVRRQLVDGAIKADADERVYGVCAGVELVLDTGDDGPPTGKRKVPSS
jgi:hypothetical protein